MIQAIEKLCDWAFDHGHWIVAAIGVYVCVTTGNLFYLGFTLVCAFMLWLLHRLLIDLD